MPFRLHQLTLTQFRNHAALRLQTQAARYVVITGANGAGKTNILESISLLSPGRGLRGTSAEEFRAIQAPVSENWSVAAEVENAEGRRLRIGTTSQMQKGTAEDRSIEKRILRVDGKTLQTHAEVLPFFSVLWLTPQMDGLFLDAPSARRRFFDRLISAYAPTHAAHLARYEKNMRARLHLIMTQPSPDAAWLDQLENLMAQDGSMMTRTRQDVLLKLSSRGFALQAFESSFPIPRFTLNGHDLETLLVPTPADLMRAFRAARVQDRTARATSQGPHRDDVLIFNADNNMPAAQSSTGEQKALLLSTILMHALFLKSERGSAPVLLLDEIPAHLDDRRRAALFALLSALDGQVWLTGTDATDFAAIKNESVFFTLQTPASAARA